MSSSPHPLDEQTNGPPGLFVPHERRTVDRAGVSGTLVTGFLEVTAPPETVDQILSGWPEPDLWRDHRSWDSVPFRAWRLTPLTGELTEQHRAFLADGIAEQPYDALPDVALYRERDVALFRPSRHPPQYMRFQMVSPGACREAGVDPDHPPDLPWRSLHPHHSDPLTRPLLVRYRLWRTPTVELPSTVERYLLEEPTATLKVLQSLDEGALVAGSNPNRAARRPLLSHLDRTALAPLLESDDPELRRAGIRLLSRAEGVEGRNRPNRQRQTAV